MNVSGLFDKTDSAMEHVLFKQNEPLKWTNLFENLSIFISIFARRLQNVQPVFSWAQPVCAWHKS